MSNEPDQPTEEIDPDKISTPAGLASELEEEAAETGATTEGDDEVTDR